MSFILFSNDHIVHLTSKQNTALTNEYQMEHCLPFIPRSVYALAANPASVPLIIDWCISFPQSTEKHKTLQSHTKLFHHFITLD